MLKQRILTALILIPLFVWLVLKASPEWFCVVTGLVVVLSAWEWSRLLGIKKTAYTFFYPVIIAILLFISLWLRIPNLLMVTLGWWIFALILVMIYPKWSEAWGKGVIVRSLMGFFVLIPCWLSINFIRNIYGPDILLFLFLLIWGADIGAYFVGRKWGKTKLAFMVSPGKSWQGLVGAMMTTVIIVLVGAWFLKMPLRAWLPTLGLSLVTVLFSVVGDLFESMLKRRVDMKDSSHLLPGHGGILDRIDSLTAAAPIFAFGAILLGKLMH